MNVPVGAAPPWLTEPSYLTDLTNRFVRRRRVCIQAGGHHGAWPYFLANLFETVITFEPIHHSFAALVGKGLPPNVFPMRAGLWSTTGMGEFKMSRRKDRTWKDVAARIVRLGGTIPLVPLDAIAPAQGVDFVCLDIEGAEIEALKGAANLLREQSPVLALEINEVYGTTLAAIMSALPEGYQPVATYGIDTVFVRGGSSAKVTVPSADKMSDCTVLIRSFERPQCVARLVESIRRFYADIHIIVGDDSLKPQPRSDVEWLSVGVNVGVSRGRNALLQAVRTPYFLMLDDDYVFNKHTRIELLMDVVRRNIADIATGLWRTPKGKWSRIIKFKIKNKRMTAIIVPAEGSVIPCDAGPMFFAANTDVVRRAGGWDNEVCGASEHPIFFIRMKQAGLKTVCVPDVWCDHVPERGPNYLPYRMRDTFFVPVGGKCIQSPPEWQRYGIDSVRKIHSGSYQ